MRLAVDVLRPHHGLLRELRRNAPLFLMLLPGVLYLLVNNYLPMFGVIIAFKTFKFYGGGFLSSLLRSKWVGFSNFAFLFGTQDAFLITRNTMLYNGAFIAIGLVVSVAIAVCLNELRSRRLAKLYQSIMFLPYFLSWVVVSYIVYAFLSVDLGLLNRAAAALFGAQPVSWYGETKYWPFILVAINTWKWAGYNSIIYLAAIITFSSEYYDAACIDGAGKLQQIRHITLPLLAPLIILMTLVQIGRIFNADFGLFFHVPRNTGTLFPVTNVIDTYVYRGLMTMGDIGMSSAAALYQSVVGFVLVFASNLAVRRASPENALF